MFDDYSNPSALCDKTHTYYYGLRQSVVSLSHKNLRGVPTSAFCGLIMKFVSICAVLAPGLFRVLAHDLHS